MTTSIPRRVFACKTAWGPAFLGAALLWLSFPPVDWWPLAWLAPTPWVLLIRRKELPGRRPYVSLVLAGFAFWMGALHWLRLPHWATSFGWIALSAYFAIYLPAFVWLSRAAVHRLRAPAALATPIVWTGLELLRAHLLTGMSMADLGHTQYRWIALIQISDLAGDYGVGFIVMLVAASLARTLPCGDDMGENRGDRLRPLHLLPAAAVMAVVIGYGYFRISDVAAEPGPKVAIIQGSIDVEMRNDEKMGETIFREYYDLSREAVQKNAGLDLILWPETMFLRPIVTVDADVRRPVSFDGTDAEYRERLSKWAEQNAAIMAQTARSLGAPMILGVDAVHYGADGLKCFNSAVHVGRDGRPLGRYDKIHLVMFGEYVPLTDVFPWLQQLTPLPGSATPGSRPVAFDVQYGGKTFRVAPSICYETVLSHVIRGQINALTAEGRAAPDLLVNLTNDGWFWGSSELDMHLACGVFRAVECRKPLLIAANTGFSAWIDGDGRIRDQGPRRVKDVLIARPALDRRRSWYLDHGDWFAGACLTCCACIAVVVVCGGRKRAR